MSNSLLSQMSRLPLYSNVLFIRLVMFLSIEAICPSVPSPAFSLTLFSPSLHRTRRLFRLKFWLEYIPGEKKKMLEEGVPGLILNPTKTSKSRVEELKKRKKG